jgi:hypothetical protein
MIAIDWKNEREEKQKKKKRKRIGSEVLYVLV